MTVVWCQIANILIKKTKYASIINYRRLLNNKMLIYSIIFEIFLVCLIVYTPGLNNLFNLAYLSPKYASSGIWMIFLIIFIDEIRKYFIR